ncbi:MAG: carbohydrate ABC transporter permease [Spirochaetes bacterium]|nr:MAG: carbohydrate ABC transporter permease [Spirochaetota bacterium]
METKLYVKVLKYLLIVVLALLFLFPIYWMFTMAFKPYAEWTAAGGKIYWVPNHPTFDNFRTIFTRQLRMNPIAGTALRPIVNSLIVSTIGTAIAMIVGTFAAYGISRYKAGGQLPFFLLQLRMFPPIAIIIPIMIMWAFLRMIDTWYGLVVIYGVVTLPFSTWLMKTFFDDIPKELDEAAIVDGCSNFGAFRKVILPLAKGGIASTALFVFILNWSDFLIALVLTDRKWTTIPVHISKLQSALVGQLYGPKAALGVIAIIPPIVFGILIQKYLVRGLTFGAIKK